MCDGCRAKLTGHAKIVPEQVLAQLPKVVRAVLIDQWGRANPIGATTVVGRDGDKADFAILDAGTSRTHARIVLDHGTWKLSDLGSLNGTIAAGRIVRGDVTLQDRAEVRFGSFRCFFMADLATLPKVPTGRPTTTTDHFGSRAQTLEIEDAGEHVLHGSMFVFHEPTGGGGGVVEIDDKRVQLTLAQFELMVLLAERMEADCTAAAETRGFMDAETLLKLLSLDSPEAGANNLRQLVLRVRRALVKAKLGDLIESRQGMGYRLGVIPSIRRSK